MLVVMIIKILNAQNMYLKFKIILGCIVFCKKIITYRYTAFKHFMIKKYTRKNKKHKQI